MSDIQSPSKEALAAVQQTIEKAERFVRRPKGDVTLVAVSKTFPAEDICAVLDAGHRVFGENRVQEAHGKWPNLQEKYADVELHLIGPLQSNKVDEAVSLFDVIETLDREKLARALVQARDKGHALPDLFIQVNTGAEPQKSGVLAQEADAFIAHCRDELALPVMGLMCIPPADEEPALHFALLEKIAHRNGISQLSMGMSGDFETAIEFGATHVRVGSAIFGSRTKA
jgi:PLP dependent protein